MKEQKQDTLLNHINGEKGIVSLIGQANVGNSMGERIVYSPISKEVELCNTLSNIFFRTKDPINGNPGAVYTSVVHTNNKLYFSFQGDAQGQNPAALNLTQVNKLIDQLKYLNPKNHEHVMDLFITMHRYKNNIVGNKLAVFVFNAIQEHHKSSCTETTFIKALQNLNNYPSLGQGAQNKFLNQELNHLSTDQNFKKFVLTIFDDFGFSGNKVVGIKDFVKKNSPFIVPYIQEGEHDNYGVHVEAKGLYTARTANKQSSIFNVGLAISKLDEKIGCCAGCTAEFEALTTSTKINRTADYPFNFPPTNYKVSRNVTDKESVLKNYAEILLERGKKVNKDNKLNLDKQLTAFENVFNFTGQGYELYLQNSYWLEYSKEAMDKLLQLRLESADISKDIKVISPNYVFDGFRNSAERLAKDISSVSGDKVLVILNLYSKHWVGIVIDKSHNEVNLHYMDSEQQTMPALLKEKLQEALITAYPRHQINIIETELELQKYNNCGLEVIENFVLYLTGDRLEQKDALPVHSLLYEDILMLGASEISYT